MAVILEDRDRIVVPRWREFNRKNLSVEHLPIKSKTFERVVFDTHPDFLNKCSAWVKEQTTSSAVELVNGAHALDLDNHAISAAQFLKVKSDLPKPLHKVVGDILGEYQQDKRNTFYGKEPSERFFRFIGDKLSDARTSLIHDQRNGLAWLEVARLHSILGNNKKAENALTIAQALSKGLNRAVTRASSRFYFHIGDTDRAHEIVRTSPLIKVDPLIMASEISYAIKRKRHSNYVKRGIEIIESSSFSPTLISDLSSTIGTLEMFNGSIKSSRKYVGKSLISPNDNSLAQAEWVSRHISNIDFSQWLDKIDFTFEAKANEFLYHGKYQEALNQGFNWMIDQPFSQRAIVFTSYISLAILKNHNATVEICKFGLHSNSDSFEITSNLTYALAFLNKIDEARQQLANMNSFAKEEVHQVFLNANEGLINFRDSNFIAGDNLYRKAIDLAGKLKLSKLKISASMNFVREQFFANRITREEALSQITNLEKEYGSKTVEIEVARKEIIEYAHQPNSPLSN